MKIITDPTVIKYRTGLQSMRDNLIFELGDFIDELRENIQIRRTRNVPVITDGDLATLQPILEEICSIQAELALDDAKIWSTKSQQDKDRIVKVFEGKVLKEMVGATPPDTIEILAVTVPLLTEELKKK